MQAAEAHIRSTHSTITARCVDFLIRWRWVALSIAVIAAAVAYPLADELAFDRSIEKMFAKDDPLLPPYRQLKSLFGGNEIVLAAYVDKDMLKPAGYERVENLTERLATVNGVRTAISLSRTPLAAAIIKNKTASQKMLDLLEGYAIGTSEGEGEHTAAVICVLEPNQSDEQRQATVEAIRASAGEHEIPARIVGEPVMVTDGFRFVSKDGETLGYTTLVLLAATILACFRSVRWVLIPLAVIQLTILMTRAVLVASGLELSMVSSMLTAIITVISVATVVHIIVRFRDARARGASPRGALQEAGQLLAVPIVLACATDAVGFAALLWARVGPVQDFGVMMAIGSLLVIPSVAMLVPALVLAGRIDVDPKRAWGEGTLDTGLDRLVEGLLKRPKTVISISLVFAVLVAAGSARLQVETNFTKNFRASSEIARSYEFVESHLGGAGVLDVIVDAPNGLDEDLLADLETLGDRLRNEVVALDDAGRETRGLTKVLSVADVLAAGQPSELLEVMPADQLAAALSVDDVLVEIPIERLLDIVPVESFVEEIDLPAPVRAMMRFGSPETVLSRLPPTMLESLVRQMPPQAFLRLVPADRLDAVWGQLSPAFKLRVMRQMAPEIVASLASDGESHVRIMLRAREQAPAQEKQRIIAKVDQICREVCDARQAETAVTGFYVLLTSLVESMIRDQWICFAWAMLGIGIMMLIAFRSLRLAVIALLPNAIPILMVTGLMGWFGVKINMGAAMIAAVSLGLSIDSSIHYISAYRRARGRGAEIHDALQEVHRSVGRALVFATLALIIGFAALCTSQFVPTIYFGALVSLSMLGGLFGNLVVLPVMLILARV